MMKSIVWIGKTARGADIFVRERAYAIARRQAPFVITDIWPDKSGYQGYKVVHLKGQDKIAILGHAYMHRIQLLEKYRVLEKAKRVLSNSIFIDNPYRG